MIESHKIMYVARCYGPRPSDDELAFRIHSVPPGPDQPMRQVQILVDAGFRIIGYTAVTDGKGGVINHGAGMLYDLSGRPTGEGVKAGDISMNGPLVHLLMPKHRETFRDPRSRKEYDRLIASGELDPDKSSGAEGGLLINPSKATSGGRPGVPNAWANTPNLGRKEK